jgi:hypothetical protein
MFASDILAPKRFSYSVANRPNQPVAEEAPRKPNDLPISMAQPTSRHTLTRAKRALPFQAPEQSSNERQRRFVAIIPPSVVWVPRQNFGKGA